MRSVKERLAFAAHSPLPLLLTGETGTGKGVCARLVHRMSNRAQRPFIRYQPNFGSPDLVASELFGHVKGTFTGAVGDRRGLLHEAHGGTLFLDEVDELPHAVQITLLETLQEGTFRRVGGTNEERSDVRLIAAFNRPVSEVLETGKLRRDFYHRIAHLVVGLPALRDRRSDIPCLVMRILRSVEEKHGLPPLRIADEATALLLDREWPGNVRELQGAVEASCYSARMAGRVTIEARDFSGPSAASPATVKKAGGLDSLVQRLKEQAVRECLARHNGNQSEAARELGVDRKTLRRISKAVSE